MKEAHQLTKRQWITTIALSYCGALALNMRFAIPKLSAEQQANILAESFWNLRDSLRGTSVNSTLLFLFLTGLGVLIYRMKNEKNTSIPRTLLPVSFVIALVWLMGASFNINDTLEAIDTSLGQIVKSVCYVLGCTYLLYEIGQFLFLFLKNISVEQENESGWLNQLRQRHPLSIPFFAVLLFWLPHLIIAYPGYMCYDAWYQLSQYFGAYPFTSHHPPIHTLFLGMFAQLGLKTGNGSIGLYLSIVVQALIEAAIFARVFLLMGRWKTPKWLQIGSFFTVTVAPYYTSYMNLALKDNLYAVFLLLFVLECICILEEGKHYFVGWKHKTLLSIAIMGTLLFRNNGKYALYPTMLGLLIYLGITWRKNGSKKDFIKAIGCFLGPVFLSSIVTMTVTTHYRIENGSIREALSLPFQQTARYVLERGNEVTEEEAQVIEAVLDYEHLAEKYNPRISDPVKSTYKDSASREDLLKYLLTWFKMFFKHPEIYIKATINQNYYLLYPFTENAVLYNSTFPNGVNHPTTAANAQLGITVPESLQTAKTTMSSLYQVLFSLPIIGPLSHQAPYNLLLIALFLFVINQKNWKWLVLSIPLIFSDIIIILAPVIQGHPRYAFPIIYAMPIMLAYYIYLEQAKICLDVEKTLR